MYSEQLYEKCRTWAGQGTLLLRDLLPLMAPVGRYSQWDRAERETVTHVLTACARASESALLLTAYCQLWDADVLVRSVAEGSLKLSYMLQNPNTFQQRQAEYSRDLFQVAILKDHKKAQDLLSTLDNPRDREWDPIRELLLPPEELAEINSKYPQARRRALESKWGFTGLAGELARSGDPLFQGIPALAHNYSMASHVHHVDTIGASLPLERDRRPPERGESIQAAHAARLVSDIFSFLFLRLYVGYRFVAQDPAPLFQARERVQPLKAQFREAYEAWMGVEYPTSQRPQ